MNGTQQRAHRTATLQLASSLNELAEATSAAIEVQDAKRAEVVTTLQRQIGEERTHRLQLADEQRAYVDKADASEATWRRENDNLQVLRLEALEAWQRRGFWSRLNWLLRGK